MFLALQTEFAATRSSVETADVEGKAAWIVEPVSVAAGHRDGGLPECDEQTAGGASERAPIVFVWAKRVTNLLFPVLLVTGVESVFSRNA